MRTSDKPVVWLHGEVKSPPFSVAARVEAGALRRRLQRGERLQMPVSRPLSQIGARVHEPRIVDGSRTWRVVYRTDPDAIVVAEVFGKTTRQTPVAVLRTCQRRFRAYDAASTAED